MPKDHEVPDCTHPCDGGLVGHEDAVPGSSEDCVAVSKVGGHLDCAAWGAHRVLPCLTLGEGSCEDHQALQALLLLLLHHRHRRLHLHLHHACHGRAGFQKGQSSSTEGGSMHGHTRKSFQLHKKEKPCKLCIRNYPHSTQH